MGVINSIHAASSEHLPQLQLLTTLLTVLNPHMQQSALGQTLELRRGEAAQSSEGLCPRKGSVESRKHSGPLLSGCGGRAVCHSRGWGHGALGFFFRQAGLWDSECVSLETRAQPGQPLLPGLPQISGRMLGSSEAVFSSSLPCMWHKDPLMVVCTQGTSLQGVFMCENPLSATPACSPAAEAFAGDTSYSGLCT